MVASAYRLDGGYEEIKRLCYAGLDAAALMQQVTQRLQHIVQFEAYCSHMADPLSGLMTSVLVDANVSEKQRRVYMQRVYFEEDFPQMRTMIRRGMPVRLLSELTGGRLERALRYREINAPLGLAHEMLSVCVTGHEQWGGMCLIREKGRPDFDERETRLVRHIGPHVAAGLKQASLRAQASAAAGDLIPGMLVLDAHGRVIRHTAAAERWLAELPDFGPRWMEGAGLPTPVWMVMGALRQALSPFGGGERGGVPRVLAPTRSGRWLTLHGSQTLAADGRAGETVVIVEPARPQELAWLRGSAYGLSERERDVVERVVQGASTREIARALYLSEYTVQEHLTNVFNKVGVRGRRALLKKLFFDNLAPGLMQGPAREN